MTSFVEAMRSDGYRGLPQSEKSRKWAEVMKEIEEMPLSEVEKRWKKHTETESYQEGYRAWGRAAQQLQTIRLLSSAQNFLQRFGPIFPPELTEIAREEGLNLPVLSELSPKLRDALKRVVWDEPVPVRDF